MSSRACCEDKFVLSVIIMKPREALRRFRRAGVAVEPGRGKGGHVMLRYGDRFTFLTTASKDLGPVYLRKVCKALGLHYEDVF